MYSSQVMKKTSKPFFISLSVFALLSGLSINSIAQDEDGLSSPGSSQASGTAGVRGGDVMGRALLKAHPNYGAVSKMENRHVSKDQLHQFQKQGKLGGASK